MKVRFKSNSEPCIQYDLIDFTDVMHFDELVYHKYVPHIRISLIGLVPKELIVPATHRDNVDAVDMMLCLKAIKKLLSH